MAWPPAQLPVNYANATVSLDTHPTAHNNTNNTINQVINHFYLPPGGTVTGGGTAIGPGSVIVAVNVPAPSTGYGPCTLHAMGSVTYFPRSANPIFVVQFLRLTSGDVFDSPNTYRFLPSGTAAPEPVDTIGTTYIAKEFATSPIDPTPIQLIGATTDAITYPTSGDSWISWWWTH